MRVAVKLLLGAFGAIAAGALPAGCDWRTKSATVAARRSRKARSRMDCHERRTEVKSASRGCSSMRSSGLPRSMRAIAAFHATDVRRRQALDVL